MNIIKWTPEEDEIVRRFWKGNARVEDALKLLPGRTPFAITHRAHCLGCPARKPGPKPQMEKNVIQLIKTRGPISAAEMARMLLCKPQQVDLYVRRLKKAKKIHVADWLVRTEQNMARMWSFGNRPDVPRPTNVSPTKIVPLRPPAPHFTADPLMAALFGRAA